MPVAKRNLRRIVQPPNARHGTKFEGIVGTQCAMPNSINSTASGKQLQSRTGHYATSDLRAIKLAFANWYINSDNPGFTLLETASGGTLTVTASIEYPAGVHHQILFNGSVSGTAATGSTVFSDYVRLGTMIPEGAQFWVNSFQTNPTAILYVNWSDSGRGDGVNNAASGLTDLTMGGTPPSFASSVSAPPFLIIGMTRRPSVGAIGDSICAGYKGDQAITDCRRGIICSGFPDMGSSMPANGFGFINLGLSSEQAADFLIGTNGAERQKAFPYLSHCVCNYGFNDLNAGGLTSPQLITVLGKVYGLLPRGCRVSQTTLTPYTTSSGSIWQQNSDQTIVGPSGQFLEKVAFNTALRAGSVPGVNNGCFDVAANLNSGPDNGFWVGLVGTNNYYTLDGIHGTQRGYNLGANGGFRLINSAITAGGVNGGTTSGFDSTGADLGILTQSYYPLAGTPPTPTDSKGNTWNMLTPKAGANFGCVIWWSHLTSVGSGHTVSTGGIGNYTGGDFMAWKGSSPTPFDGQSAGGSVANGSSVQAGALALAQAGELAIFATAGEITSTVGVSGSGFAVDKQVAYSAGVSVGHCAASSVLSSAGSVNPTFSWSGTFNSAAVSASFLPAVATANGINLWRLS
jgi:hypothetical protein